MNQTNDILYALAMNGLEPLIFYMLSDNTTFCVIHVNRMIFLKLKKT